MTQRRILGQRVLVLLTLVLFSAVAGCSFGPKVLERSHRKYNDAIKQVFEEELLLNLVRLRYNDDLIQLDVSAVSAQYELSGGIEGRSFFEAPNPAGSTFRTFSMFLPDVTVGATNRPTISMMPLNDADDVRPLFVPATLDGIIFLSETSWPIETVFRLWLDSMNLVPNAVTAGGPARCVVPEYRDFHRAVELLQWLKDAGAIRFIREERVREIGSPLAETAVTAAALLDAAKNGFEYLQKPDKSWVLIRRDRRLELCISPPAVVSPEVQELCALLRLKPGLDTYDITVGEPAVPTGTNGLAEPATAIRVLPRSTVQALFYMSYGVLVPPEHLREGVVRTAVHSDGQVFDWQEVTDGLFTVHAVKQHARPKCAHVAVRYRDYWFYIDDRDADSKTTFALMMVMTRINLIGSRKGGAPVLTLPVGR